MSVSEGRDLERSTWKEFAVVTTVVAGIYSCILASMCYFNFIYRPEYLNFDHPEPNYLVFPQVAEFWSTLTVFPVAGANALYTAWKYKYDKCVAFMYVLTCLMYTEAFASHATLDHRVFSCTVSSVMSNAIYALMFFGWVAGGILKNTFVRFVIGVMLFGGIVYSVRTLQSMDEWMGERPGFTTLFVVQTPGVFAAWMGANFCLRGNPKEKNECLHDSFDILTKSGAILMFAMFASFFETVWGFEYGLIHSFYGFPWMHTIVHVAEQIGIYMYCVGVAGLHHSYGDGKRPRTAIQWAGFWPYCVTPEKKAITNTFGFKKQEYDEDEAPKNKKSE